MCNICELCGNKITIEEVNNDELQVVSDGHTVHTGCYSSENFVYVYIKALWLAQQKLDNYRRKSA